ncbi:unnamed protein product, partial [Rotaria magnacalcarata]
MLDRFLLFMLMTNLFYSTIQTSNMYGGGYGQYGGGMGEMRSDMWINQNIPGGVNSALGERLDNYMGGNSNPTYGQIYGGAPGVGGYGGGNGYGGGYGYQYGG